MINDWFTFVCLQMQQQRENDVLLLSAEALIRHWPSLCVRGCYSADPQLDDRRRRLQVNHRAARWVQPGECEEEEEEEEREDSQLFATASIFMLRDC